MEPLTPKSISKISASLRNVKEVLENLTMMADFLDVSQDTKLTNCNLQTKPGYECIKNILSDWAAREGSKATIKSLQDTFVEMDLNQAAEILNDIDCAGPSFSSKSFQRIKILKPVLNFTGREKELLLMKKWYDSKSNHVFVISAMGGQGKTELARKFIDDHKPNRHCAWLNGDGAQIFIDSLGSFMSHAIHKKDRKSQTFKDICDELFSCRKIDLNEWLLIVDNVDAIFQEFVEFVREATTRGAIFIVTGRTLEFFPGECEVLCLESLCLEDAQIFFGKLLGPDEGDDDLTDLCGMLECHPLAMAQAVTYIKAKRQLGNPLYSTRDYMNALGAEKLNYPLHLHSNSYNKTFCRVVSLSISAAKSYLACSKCVDIALIILALVKQSGIQYQDFLELFSRVKHNMKIEAGDRKGAADCPSTADEVVTTLSNKVSLIRRDKSHIYAPVDPSHSL